MRGTPLRKQAAPTTTLLSWRRCANYTLNQALRKWEECHTLLGCGPPDLAVSRRISTAPMASRIAVTPPAKTNAVL